MLSDSPCKRWDKDQGSVADLDGASEAEEEMTLAPKEICPEVED